MSRQGNSRGEKPLLDHPRGANSDKYLFMQQRLQENDESSYLLLKITLVKGKKGFGFAFSFVNKSNPEDKTISITKLVSGGVAQSDGRLRIGDVIVSANNINFEEVPYLKAIDTLKNSGPNLTLFVRRIKDEYSDNESSDDSEPVSSNYAPPENVYTPEEDFTDNDFNQFEVVLNKRSGRSLGIVIDNYYSNNSENDVYISISKLTRHGVAESDGRLEVGDIILQIDDETLEDVSLDDAIEMLKNTGSRVTLIVGRFIQKKKVTNRFSQELGDI